MKNENVLNHYPKIKKRFLLMLLSFIAVFLLRLGYEMFIVEYDIVQEPHYNYINSLQPVDVGYTSYTNIGTARIIQRDQAGQHITIDQKYEKSAHLSIRSSDFPADNHKLRSMIETNQGVIQVENLTGMEGSRKLTLTVGVIPESFDEVVETLKSVGDLQGFMVNKVDKTEEFRSLLAEQETLEKTRASYLAIKEKGGSIQDLLLLEDRILEVERSLQNLGVDLGIYSSESSLCTINITLNEMSANDTAGRITGAFVAEHVSSSLTWTVTIYMLIILIVVGGLAAVTLSLVLTLAIKRALEIFRTNQEKQHNKS